MTKDEYYNQEIPLEEGIFVERIGIEVRFSILHQTFSLQKGYLDDGDDGDDVEEHAKWVEIQLKKALSKLKFKNKWKKI